MERTDNVTVRHLSRDAYLYIRQSTLRQVMENQESTRRQYALKERAVALGWPTDRITVIDEDLGQSGAGTEARAGFRRLVTDVGMGKVGIVLGLEVSRLARSSSDWYRLLEICAMSETLILDEDGLYDPANFNDRLLLGLKGTMSEAELHFLRARMQGGLLNKAGRGELRVPLPIGLVYAPDGRVALDPDRQVQDTVRLFFETFQRTGAATAVVREFGRLGIGFPQRLRRGPHKGEVRFVPLTHSHVLATLKNPRYAGAYVFGRRRERRLPGGKLRIEHLPPDQWTVFMPDSHPGYITWEVYEGNIRRLHENAQALGSDRRGPPREGPAMLQGLTVCGVCGLRMTVRYRYGPPRTVPIYVCQRESIEHGDRPVCQSIVGSTIDQAVGDLVLEAVSPVALEAVLKVQEELGRRGDEAMRVWHDAVERARYDADLARRRFMQVDPDNRLVASMLEADWNTKLRTLEQTQEAYEQRRQTQARTVDDAMRERARTLAQDLPRLWRDPDTPIRERKRMVRLVIEDVTLVRQGPSIRMQVRFRGGATRVLDVVAPPPAYEAYRTPPELVAALDELLNEYTDQECVDLLNGRGIRSGYGLQLTRSLVVHIRSTYGLKTHSERLRARGLLTAAEMATRLGVEVNTVHVWHRRGLLRAWPAQSHGHGWLFELPADDLPGRHQRKRRWLEGRSRPTERTVATVTSPTRPIPVLRNTQSAGGAQP